MYILQRGALVTAHRRPHAPAFDERVVDPFLDLSRTMPGEPAPNLHGWRLAHVDARGDWRLDGSERLVAAAPALPVEAMG